MNEITLNSVIFDGLPEKWRSAVIDENGHVIVFTCDAKELYWHIKHTDKGIVWRSKKKDADWQYLKHCVKVPKSYRDEPINRDVSLMNKKFLQISGTNRRKDHSFLKSEVENFPIRIDDKKNLIIKNSTSQMFIIRDDAIRLRDFLNNHYKDVDRN